MEAREGFAPSHNGFADRRVASSPPGHTLRIAEMIVSYQKKVLFCRGGGMVDAQVLKS